MFAHYLSGLLFFLTLIPGCGATGEVPQEQGSGPTTLSGLAVITVPIPANSAGRGPDAYGPNPLVVLQGTTVNWINYDKVPHTTTSISGVWNSGTMVSNQTFQYTFDTPGDFPYYCRIHGPAAMSGIIRVAPFGHES